MVKDARRHRRVPYIGPVTLSWTISGEPRYARGRCIDVSEGGIRLELPVAIAAGTDISLNAERIRISGQARVKHCTRYGAKYLAGLELSQTLREQALRALRDPQSLRTTRV